MPGNITNSVNARSLKDVYRINNLLSGMALVFSVSFLVLEQYRVPLMGLKSGLYIFSAGYCQAFILRFCASRYSDKPFTFKAVRYSLGFGSGILLYFLFWFIFSVLTDVDSNLNESRWIIIYTMIAAFLNFMIFLLHDFVIIRRAKIQADTENYRLQIRNTQAENLVLKQQIHPHFLFNALNTLNLLYKKDQTMGEQYLLRLSDFLRVAVSHNSVSVATLEQELSICNNYLEMQKIRFNDALNWQINIEDENTLTKVVPSFSLQPLLENAIKHNSLTNDRPLMINIRQYDETIEISNNINKKKYSEISLQSGLSNLAERYRLLSGEDITVRNNGDVFLVSFNFVKA